MKMTEIIGCSADAVSTCHSAIAWNLGDDGTIILSFKDKLVDITDFGIPESITELIIEEFCPMYDFEYSIKEEDFCQCDSCKKIRSQFN